MKETKFRAWDIEYGHMYQNAYPFEHLVYVEMHDDDETFQQYKHKMEIVNGKYFYFIVAKNMALMQYTTLKDKDNKLIFEGDIIRRGYFAGNDFSKFGNEPWLHLPEGVKESDITTVTETFVVGWDISDLQKISEAIRSNPDVLGVEIIGNLYENAELVPEAWKIWNKYNER